MHGRPAGLAGKGNLSHRPDCAESLAWVDEPRGSQSMSPSEHAPGPRASPHDPQAPPAVGGPEELLADMAKTLS